MLTEQFKKHRRTKIKLLATRVPRKLLESDKPTAISTKSKNAKEMVACLGSGLPLNKTIQTGHLRKNHLPATLPASAATCWTSPAEHFSRHVVHYLVTA